MTTFGAQNVSEADVPADRDAIWAVLSEPDLLAEMTPLIDRIHADGDRWCWQLTGINALGLSVAPSFTEQMTFRAPESITFRHAPDPGSPERAGASGRYELEKLSPGRTRLFVDITLHVDLPLPARSRRLVERVMKSMMERTGQRFGQNLYNHLGIDPAAASSRTLVSTGVSRNFSAGAE